MPDDLLSPSGARPPSLLMPLVGFCYCGILGATSTQLIKFGGAPSEGMLAGTSATL